MSESEFVVLGGGAMGSILAAHLARARHSVTVVARGRRATQIERDGLRIKGLADITIPVQVLRDPSQVNDAETLIVAMKAVGTRDALERFLPGSVSVAISIQNGLGKTDVLAETLGRDRVMGAVADISGELLENGDVLFTRNANLFIGELSGESGRRAQRLAHIFEKSGIRAVASDHILDLEWSKFCAWAGLMALSITTRSFTWRYLSDSGSAVVLVRIVRELGSLATAAGVHLTDSAVLPVASICSVDEATAVEMVVTVGNQFRANASDHKMSSLQDLECGKPLEVEETLGFAHHRARQMNLALPLLDAFYHIATAINHLQAKTPRLETM